MELKIPFYNLVNILFIGAVFVGMLVLLLPMEMSELIDALCILDSPTLELVVMLALSYQVGLIINWIGSLVTETLLVNKNPAKPIGRLARKLKIEWRTYTDFQLAENDKLRMLNREMNVARNNLTSFFIVFVIAAWVGICDFLIVLPPLLVLFYCAYRKQSKKIVCRIDESKKRIQSE